jgi:hypothetical protein
MDVNKRVSRVAANIPFIKHNLCPLSFIDVSVQVYTDAVLGPFRASPETIRKSIPSSVVLKDYEKFTQLVMDEFANLHEGNISRFKLKLSDFRTWQSLLSDE